MNPIKHITTIIITSLCSLMPMKLYADTGVSTNSNSQTLNIICPDIKNIEKNQKDMTWFSKPDFKSYNKSFATGIKKFVGAQWVGQTVGQVACFYQGTEARTFPIQLIFHAITLEPTTGQWGKNKGGSRICASAHQSDCAFTVRIQQDSQDIYQQAEELKSDTNNDIDAEPGY